MKIDDSIKKTAGLPVSQLPVRADKGADKPSATVPAPVASAILSSQVRAMSTKIASSGSSFDSVKIEAIKAAIANGTFKVDPEKVASGLLDSVSELIQTKRKG